MKTLVEKTQEKTSVQTTPQASNGRILINHLHITSFTKKLCKTSYKSAPDPNGVPFSIQKVPMGSQVTVGISQRTMDKECCEWCLERS